MKLNKWTVGLASVGLVSLTPALFAQTAAQQGTPLLTSLSATTISGYVDTSAVWNPGTGNANPAPYAFNKGEQDGFNLDAVDIKLAKPLEEGKWSAGYVAEGSFGQEASAVDGAAYPIRQAYVELGVPIGNGLDIKMGRMDALLGYESSDAMNNPNWTRSYGKTFEPTEGTGALASYKFADWIGLQAGVMDTLSTTSAGATYGNFGNARTASAGPGVESKKAFTALLTLIAPDSWGFLKGSALYGGFAHGQGVYEHDMTEWYAGTTITTPLTGLTLGASYDSIDHSDVAGVDAGYFEAVAGYISYKITDKSSINGRAEYANGGALGVMANEVNGTTDNGLNKVFALTGTYEYDLWANVISRLEVRWDHDAGGGPAFGGRFDTAGVAGAPAKSNAVLIAANVIYKF